MKPLEIVLIVIIVVLLLALTGMFVLNFFKPSKKVDASSSEAKNKLEDILIQNQKLQAQLDMMQKTYIALNETINKTGMDSSKNIAFLSEKIETLDKYQKDLNKFNTEIKTNLENIHTTTKNIPSISSEIKGISDIYKNSKHRGNFGEIQLKLIFDDIFGNNPDFVQGQYKIKTGAVVDYIIKIGDHIVPIDSKFPLDNYRKANEAKNEIEITHAKQLFKKDIVAKFKEVIKYVNPKEGIENAIVFIPSEVMFADILAWYSNDILLEASNNHVLLCSPTTIIAMLKLFLVNQKDRLLSKNIEVVKKQISKIFVDFHNVHKNWLEYIRTLSTLTNKAKQLTNTNTQILKRMRRVEDSNQEFLEDVTHTIDESMETKEQLEKDISSLRSNFDDDNSEDL